MATFTAFGSDILNDPNIHNTGNAGQDGAGQILVARGSSPFENDYVVEFTVINTDEDGEFSGNTAFTGIQVFASNADYLAGNALYTYTPQNAGQTASVQDSVDRMGDEYVRFGANIFTSSDPGAPSLNTLFVAPGSDVGNGGTTTFDRNADVDHDGDGQIEDGSTEDGNGRFITASSRTVCFTERTMIQTPSGPRQITDLQIGDRITTRDNGPKPIVWIGRRPIARRHLVARVELRPILIPKGVMGATHPTFVSRQHALLRDEDTLIPAIALTRATGSRLRIAHGQRKLTYLHLMLEQHEIIFANGIACESYYPGPQALRMLQTQQRREVLMQFPDLKNCERTHQAIAQSYGPRARQLVH